MREKSKVVRDSSNNDTNYYYSSSDVPCKKHPSSSAVGICPYCLKERLVNLVCSDCGEQRLSSCSCSEISSNRNSCTMDVGSVGRVSFLIENEKNDIPILSSKIIKPQEKIEEILFLKRSSSGCVKVKRSGIWRIGKLFRKKKDKTCGISVAGFDERSENWVVDHGGVSRSRSLCSFRGVGFFGSEDGVDSILSGARSSISAARSSSVNGAHVLESGRRSGFSEAEPRRSNYESEKKDYMMDTDNAFDLKTVKKAGLYDSDNGFNAVNRRIFSLRESDFKGIDESSFIDLKLDFTSESKTELSASKMCNLAETLSSFGSMRDGILMANEIGRSLGVGDRMLSTGGSCRITTNDRGIKRGRKSLKGWRWFFRHDPQWGTAGKKHEDLAFKT